jgi:hypothetical protein
MKRLTRRVVLVGARFAAALAACFCAATAALAAVVVVGCIYCRLTTDAVFGARLPRLAAVRAACVLFICVQRACTAKRCSDEQ